MVTRAISELLDANSPAFPRFTTALTMDTFRAGHMVSISRKPDAMSHFKLLQGVDEIWAMSVRKPRDFQARLLGRFVQKDIFVGTQLHLRSDLGGSANYKAAAEKAASEWNSITCGQVPLRSSLNVDYLGHVVRDIDDDD